MENNLLLQNNADILEMCQLKQQLAIAIGIDPEKISMGNIAAAIESHRKNLLDSNERDVLLQYDRVRHGLIKRNQKMAYYMMWRRRSPKKRVDSDDLGSDAVLGLIMGIDRFDAIKFPNLQLSTYVRFWVKQQLKKNFDRVDLIRTRGDTLQLAAICASLEKKMHKEGKAASVEMIADELCLPVDYVRRLLYCYFSSIESPQDVDCKEYEPDLAAQNRDDLQFIKSLLPTLPKQQKQVLDAVYFGHVPVEELASRMGLSRSRIRQIHRDGIERLRRNVEKKIK